MHAPFDVSLHKKRLRNKDIKAKAWVAPIEEMMGEDYFAVIQSFQGRPISASLWQVTNPNSAFVQEQRG